jgi:hypothetical protein
MNSFVQRHASSVIGVLSGFDRLLFRGTLRMLATAKGLMGYLWSTQTLLKNFGQWSEQLTAKVREESEQAVRKAGRPIVYINDPSARKEDIARDIARRDGIDQGVVCMLTAVEPCWSYDIHRSREKKKLELVCRQRKCLHLYHYQIHPQLGLMHARLQTWLPFNVKVCLNGREWLGRLMDQAEVTTDLKQRPEGIRLKHQVNRNSVKMYDKQGSVLRVETTINNTKDFKVYRKTEGKPQGKPKNRQLRKGIADLHRRAEVSHACNERYLEAMAAVETSQTLGELTAPLCKATTWKNKRVRPLHPLGGDDAELLQAISNGNFLVNGFRNRDLRDALYAKAPSTAQARRQSGAVTRKLRLLRAHGLIKKVPRTHRYLLTDRGRLIVTALQAAKAANPIQLVKIAA